MTDLTWPTWAGLSYVSFIAPVEGEYLHLADVEQVNRIVVTGVSSKVMVKVGALPRLRDGTVVERVGLVRPDTFNKTGLLFLVVVEDGVCDQSET